MNENKKEMLNDKEVEKISGGKVHLLAYGGPGMFPHIKKPIKICGEPMIEHIPTIDSNIVNPKSKENTSNDENKEKNVLLPKDITNNPKI